MRSKTEMKSGSRRGVVLRLVKTLFSFYPVMLPIAIVGIIFDAVISAIPSVFMQNVLAVVEDTFQSRDWSAASGAMLPGASPSASGSLWRGLKNSTIRKPQQLT